MKDVIDHTDVPDSRQAHSLEAKGPKYIRLPKSGTYCPWTGLSRSKLNQLILPTAENHYSPPVKSCSLRPPGSIRGTRLILYESLMAYLTEHTKGGAA